MTCEQCTDRLTEFIEGDLPPDADREMQAHLAECPECARELEEMRALVAALHGMPEIEPPAELRERLRAIPERVGQSRSVWWRRSRTVAATLASAAAALLLVWTGVHFYQNPGRNAAPMVAEGSAEFAAEVGPETPMADESAPGAAQDAGVEREAAAPAGDAARPPAEESAERGAPGPAPPTVGNEAQPTPPVRRARPSRPQPQPEPREEPAAPPSPRVAEPGPSPVRSADPRVGEREGPTAETASSAAPRVSVPSAEADATEDSVGPAGPGGPAGPAGPAVAETEAEEPGYSRAPLTMPGPMYLDAADGAASTQIGEGTPFTVAVTPPHEKVTGTIVAATIRVEAEADVARARVTVQGSEDLQLIGVEGDEVLFEGPLTAGQETVLSVRMLAQDPGQQSLTMRLRSTDPIVDTRLEVGMGQFKAPTPPAERPVQFDFVGTPIGEAIAEITRQSGLSVTVDPDVGEATVTARAEDPVPAAAALRAVADAAGLTVAERDGQLVVERTEGEQ